ncbi:unnamed protein product [Staurois parvus]|uniref:Uncharacterized protein n=1 Tax=Staurois parvus TaxID=386267 RepID=A0ABN9GSB4_9NEOB|nr:unnamed protein product [Staurois parvus]
MAGKILDFFFVYTNTGGDQRLMAGLRQTLTLGGTDLGSLTSAVTPIQ